MIAPILVAVFIICAAIFFLNALSARADFRQAQISAEQLQQAIIAGDKPAAAKALKSLQASAHGAHNNTGNVLWKVASWVPYLGKNANAMSVVSESLDEVAQSAMPPVVRIATQLNLNTFSPKHGKINLAELATLNSPVAEANSVMSVQKAKLADIRPEDLVGPLQGKIYDFISRIDGAADATRIAHQALGLIPTMLGDTDRNYLVVFQNNAEVRATGGLPGSYLIANVKNGTISRGKQGTGSSIPVLPAPITPMTAAENSIFSGLLSRLFIDTNFTPEFPRTAQFMQDILKKQTGVKIDGVISLDPIAMSYVLAGTGPVKLTDGTVLTSSNAVEELLNKSYLRFPQQNQSDGFFKDAAAKLFDFVIAGHGDTGQTIRALVRAAQERRIYIWSDRPAEQSQLSTMAVAGALAPDSKGQPQLGVYLNDATGTKLDYYLRFATTVTPGMCSANGAQTMEARIDLASLAPANAAFFPPSIVTDVYGVKKGNMQFTVRYYLPTGSTLLSVRTNTNTLGTATRFQKGHPVYGVSFDLGPGEQAFADVVFRTPPGRNNPLKVSMTPSVQPGPNVLVRPSRCS